MQTLGALVDPATGLPIYDIRRLARDVATAFGIKDIDSYEFNPGTVQTPEATDAGMGNGELPPDQLAAMMAGAPQ